MAAPKKQKQTELDRIKASVRKARDEISWKMTLGHELNLMVARELRQPPHKRLQEIMIFALQYGRRDLRLLNEIIREAVQGNDVEFFIKLGRTLSKKPIESSWRPSNLEQMLVLYWAEARDGVPALHTLNRQSLRDVCAHVLKNSNLSADAVLKTRQRMGLATTRGRKKSVVINAKSIAVV